MASMLRFSRVLLRQVHGSATAEVKTTTLSNGIRIVTQATPSGTANVGVFIKSGSRDESKAESGISNLVERLAYKGTGKFSQHALEQQLESTGASLTSSVGAEETSFTLRSHPQHVGQGLELLADIVANPSFEDAAVEAEKKNVLAQLEKGEGAEGIVSQYLVETAFQGTPLANPILGTSASVKALNKEALKKHVASTHVGARLVLAATGNVDHEALVKQAQGAFGKVAAGSAAPAKSYAGFTGSEVRYRDDLQPEAHFAIAVEAVPRTHDDYAALLVAAAAVGSYRAGQADSHLQASSLAQNTNQEKLASSYNAFFQTYSDTGLWGIRASTDAESIDDFVYLVQKAWLSLCTGATTNEIARAQQAVLHTLSDQGGLCTLKGLGSSVLHYNRLLSNDALIDSVKDVTAGSVRAVLNKYVFDKCPAVSAYGPVEQFPDYNRLRSSMYWLRM